jgi:diguanylate cyclase (GGDEF)-like protein
MRRPNGPMRLLRSWWREEQRTPIQRASLLRNIGLCLLVLTPLLVLQMQRRTAALLRFHQGERDDTLALMEAALSVTTRGAPDWAHWDDTYRFARGSNPDFEQNSLATASLFDAGAVVVMLRPDGSPLLTHAGPSFRLPSDAALIRCVQDNLNQLPTPTSRVRLACDSGTGAIYLGTATPISNNGAKATAAGTLALFDPLLKPEYNQRIRQRLETLRRELVFQPLSSLQSNGAETPILPKIHSSANRVLAIRQQPVLPLVLQSLSADLPLLIAVPLLAASIRALQMLERRRQRIGQRLVERRANQRIQQTCRQLDQLIDGLRPMGRSGPDGPAILGRLSLRSELEQSGSDSESPRQLQLSQLEKVTNRFQRFLHTASNLALFDSLTQLPNRRYFLEHLAEICNSHPERNQPFAILFLDVDKFKFINDTYGHSVGDDVLIHVSQRLRRLMSEGDFIARYGGDELAVILDLSDLKDQSLAQLNTAARQRAQEMVISMQEPVAIGEISIAISLSIGITLVDPANPDITSVMQRSDLAMYQAKSSRGSRIIGPDDVLEIPQLSNYQLFTDLINAIREQQLQVFFQAIADSNGKRRGVEALARWRHDTRGWIEPTVFLEMAEQHRQMTLLGKELIRLSLDGFQQLQQHLPDLRLYLNLAPAQLLEPGLAGNLLEQLHNRRLGADQLTLELTEHSVLEPHPVVSGNLQQLRQAGVQLALDDFGTGYSSLLLLKSIRPDVVKIDKSFTQSIRSDSEALHIINLIADLAPRLGLELVAEGIEDIATLQLLATLGIQNFQGYALGRPAPLHDWLAPVGAVQPSSRSIV